MTRIRPATPTVACIDEYCAHYRSVFHNVRHFEQFTQLILGMLAETQRKSLPRLAKTVQGDHQAVHHFLANAEWSVDEVRAIRLRLTREALAGRPVTLSPCHPVTLSPGVLMRPGIRRKATPPIMSPPNTWGACTTLSQGSSPSTPSVNA